MIDQIKLVSIPVRDYDRALAFYTEKLGFELESDQQHRPGERWIELRLAGTDTRVVLYTPDGQHDRIGTPSNIVFTSSDVERTYEQLRGRGVEFAQPLTRAPWGTGAVLKDSEGNTIALSSKD
jgi:predicted enzyme related to lactoylglutathione lyase